MKDPIERQAAIDLVRDVCNAVMSGCNSHYDSEVGDEVYDDILEVNAILTCNKEVRKALKGMPSAQQDCTECAEYDHETKSCPYYCEVIRKTADELQVEASCKLPERKTGRWNFIGDQMFECSECGTCYTQSQFHQMRVRISDTEFPKFCPNCGAKNGG